MLRTNGGSTARVRPAPPRSHRRDRARAAAATASAAAAVLGCLVAAPAAQAATPTVSWDAVSGPDGGGVITSLTTDGKGRMLAGGDTMGLFTSTDSGDSWRPVNAQTGLYALPGTDTDGILTTDYQKVASVLYVPSVAGGGGRFYAATGSGTHGGVLAGDGDKFELMVGNSSGTGFSLPVFSGAKPEHAPLTRTRSTGNLLASDGTYLWAGSYKQGVYRCKLHALAWGMCTDGPALQAWNQVGLGPETVSGGKKYKFIRSIALEPTTKRLFVAYLEGTVDANEVMLGTSATPKVAYQDTVGTDQSWKQVSLPLSGKAVDELKFVPSTVPGGTANVLYGVGQGGIYRLSRTAATPKFEVIKAQGLPADSSASTETPAGMWTAIDGVRTKTGSRLVVTSSYMTPDGSQAGQPVRRTAYLDVTEGTDVATTGNLQPLDTESAGRIPPVNSKVAGTSRDWDLLTSRKQAIVGQRQYIGDHLLITPAVTSSGTTYPQRLWLSGKQGIYRHDFPNDPASAPPAVTGNWDASVNGLTNTFSYNVAANPVQTTPEISWTDADLSIVTSPYAPRDGKRCPDDKQVPVKGMAFGLTYLSDGTAFMATGMQKVDYANGTLWAGSVANCTWTDTNISVVNPDPQVHLRTPAAVFGGSASSVTITAYVNGLGLVRGTGSAFAPTWTRMDSNLAVVRPVSGAKELSPQVMADPAVAEISTDAVTPAQPEATKGLAMVSLDATQSTIVLARPMTKWPLTPSAYGVDVCKLASSAKYTCYPVLDNIGARLGATTFNSLVADPVTPGVVYWSAAGTDAMGAANGSDNGVWKIDTRGVGIGSMTQVRALRDMTIPFGASLAIADGSSGKYLVAVAAFPSQNLNTGLNTSVLRKNLSVSPATAFEPVPGATGSFADDAVARQGMPVSGVLITRMLPPGGTTQVTRMYVSTLGGGLVSGTLNGF